MKNLLIIAFACLMTSLSACQNSASFDDYSNDLLESSIINSSNSDDCELILKLQNFNDSLMNTTTDVQSKGDVSKAIDIALKDLYGTYKGAKLGWRIGLLFGPNGGAIGASICGPIIGAAKSYQAYKNYQKGHLTRSANDISLQDCIAATITMTQDIYNYTNYYPQNVNLNLSPELTDMQLYGAKHNLILNNLQKGYLSSTSPELVFDSIQYAIITNPEFIEGFQQIMLNIKDPKYNPRQPDLNGDRVITLYIQALKNAKSYNDIEFISNRYINEVSSSNDVDANNKNGILSSCCVMASSSEYWNVF